MATSEASTFVLLEMRCFTNAGPARTSRADHKVSAVPSLLNVRIRIEEGIRIRQLGSKRDEWESKHCNSIPPRKSAFPHPLHGLSGPRSSRSFTPSTMRMDTNARSQKLFGSETEEDRRVKENPGIVAYGETWWNDHYDWLYASGYLLRPRYRPQWTPPWEGTRKDYDEFEEGQGMLHYALMDVTRLQDQLQDNAKYVMLKKVVPPPEGAVTQEIEINKYLTSLPPEDLGLRNPTTRLHEVLQVPDDHTLKILVMPLLRPFDSPPFETFGEAVAFFTQLFKGLKFLHDHNIAHRDCTRGNIMMDATKLYPQPWHPSAIKQRRDWKGKAKHHSRTQYPVEYYFIDYGLSKHYTQGRRLELPVHGGDKSAPENQEKKYNTPCDPFRTDIYYIGNLIREQFIEKYRGFGFMGKLVSRMVQDDPLERPDIAEVLLEFEKIRSHLGFVETSITPRAAEGIDDGNALQTTRPRSLHSSFLCYSQACDPRRIVRYTPFPPSPRSSLHLCFTSPLD
ncbi:hypothetical protein EVG20_g6687 [Dentipellis fragilis]|uniref:Protein kinase domain-containing protein n=1 Tax=Dentipellis fragilis TaxID=205917 RepID=A0A4Y9YLL8_9AGAM|nr:hypothetical protein EVG20_g6687 [Dentipellis fragilis]